MPTHKLPIEKRLSRLLSDATMDDNLTGEAAKRFALACLRGASMVAFEAFPYQRPPLTDSAMDRGTRLVQAWAAKDSTFDPDHPDYYRLP